MTAKTNSAVVYSRGISYGLIRGQAQGRPRMRQKWRPQQVAADLGVQMAQWGAVGCWMADAEWSGWSARSRWRVDSADCQNHTRPLRSTTSRGRSQSARVPIGLWTPRGRKESTREKYQAKTNSTLNTVRGTPPPVTHQCRETPLSRSGRGWHTRSHTWGQRQTGSTWCASTHSYAGQATATGVHRWRGGSLYAQPPVKRMQRKNWCKGFTSSKVSTVTQQLSILELKRWTSGMLL